MISDKTITIFLIYYMVLSLTMVNLTVKHLDVDLRFSSLCMVSVGYLSALDGDDILFPLTHANGY